MKRAIATDVYIDTDVLVNIVYPELPHAEASLQEELHDAGSTVYVSALTRIEFAQAFRNLATRFNASPSLIREFDLVNWSHRTVRQRWLEYWYSELEVLLDSFPQVVDLPLEADVVQQSVRLMADHALRSNDATHLAIALHYQIPMFWTCDDHFARVDELIVDIIRAPDS